MLKRIEESDYASIRLIVQDCPEHSTSVPKDSRLKKTVYRQYFKVGRFLLKKKLIKAPFIFKVFLRFGKFISSNLDHYNSLIYQLYTFIFDNLPPHEPKALALTDRIPDFLENVPVLKVTPHRTRFSKYYSENEIREIRDAGMDILIRLGSSILRGDILHSARYGVWSYHHGDNMRYRGGPAGFWEVLEGNPLTGTIVQMLTEDLDNGIVLYRSYGATEPFSVHQNQNALFWKSASFLPRCLEKIYREGGSWLEKKKTENQQLLYSHPIYSMINSDAALEKLLPEFMQRRWNFENWTKRYVAKWILLFQFCEEGVPTSLWRYKRLIPPKDRFWADPFVIKNNGRYYIFFEEYIYTDEKGRISVMELEPDGRHSKPETILELPYHLSYPFIFEHDNCFYMIPESKANQQVDLYRCLSFPHKWEYVRTLLYSVEAVDPTLINIEGTWWLFVNISENKGASTWDELFIYHASDFLTDDFSPHPMNPVVSDVRSARPGGPVFERNDAWYRLGQNSSVRYGYGLTLNRIKTLTLSDYAEECVDRVEPNWSSDVLGIHHFSFADGIGVCDALVQHEN